MRQCVCGVRIRSRDNLCPACLAEYGADSARWPDWVAYLVREEQREANRARRHREYALCDEVAAGAIDDRYPSEMGPAAIAAAWAMIREMRGE